MSWQKDAIAAARLPVRELAQRLKPAFPRISAPAVSVALNPGESGVTFTPSASKAIAAITGYKRPRRDNRRCPVRIQARLSKADSEAFNKARRVMGHRTINDALIYALRWYIAEAKRRAAVDVAASHDDKANYYTPSIRAER